MKHLMVGLILIFVLSGCESKSETAKTKAPPSAEAASGIPPGAESFSQVLLKNFEEMKSRRGKDYKPRTKHLNPDGSPKFTNRLFL